MNTHESLPAGFPSNRNPCFDTDATIGALNVVTDDDRSFELPYAQFLYAERGPNPALENEPDAPPEKLSIHFAVATVVALGSGLKAVERALQRFELKFVKPADRRHAAMLNAHIATVEITFTPEKHEH